MSELNFYQDTWTWKPEPPRSVHPLLHTWTPNLARCAAQHLYELGLPQPSPTCCLDGGGSIAQHLNTFVGLGYVFELIFTYNKLMYFAQA